MDPEIKEKFIENLKKMLRDNGKRIKEELGTEFHKEQSALRRIIELEDRRKEELEKQKNIASSLGIEAEKCNNCGLLLIDELNQSGQCYYCNTIHSMERTIKRARNFIDLYGPLFFRI